MKAFAAQHGFTFPYVIDETQDVARAYGAVCTPDFFGFDRDLALAYRGRLDASGRSSDPDRAARALRRDGRDRARRRRARGPASVGRLLDQVAARGDAPGAHRVGRALADERAERVEHRIRLLGHHRVAALGPRG